MKQTLRKTASLPYLSSLLFYEIGRTLPHAILQILIIALGGDGSSVLALQIVYYLAISLIEIPSGVLSDVFLSKRSVYIISIVSMIVGFSIMSFAAAIWIFAIGQFFYGISQALSSGTAEIVIINSLDSEEKKRSFIN